MKLAYRLVGNAQGPAVALIHGFMSSHLQWALNEAALGAQFRLVQIELWGHGASPLPATEDIQLNAYLEAFEAVREDLALDAWHVIGQSFGAGLALRYALRYPERCRQLIATNSRSAFARPGTRIDRVEGSAKRSSTSSSRSGSELRRLPFHPIHARNFPEDLKRRMVAATDAMDPRAVRDHGAMAATLNCFDRLHALQPPLRIVNGRRERGFQQDLEALRAHYPALDIVNLEGGHSINVEAPEAFNNAVLEFFESDLPSA